MAPHHNNPKRTLIKGALWAVGTRWSIKGIGFLNTVIMARLLAPADYGVVAMAMLMVGLIQAFLDLGVATALVRKHEVGQDEIDSAWTLRVLQSLAVCAVLLLASPWVALYFQEQRVQAILWVLAPCLVLEGAGNIGLVLAHKAYDFALEFRVNVISKGLSVLATLLMGYWLGDYRALVAGIVAGYVSAFVLSYALHSYRPRWNTRKIRDLWAVTKWLMLGSMGTYFLRRSDELIAARVGSATEYGTYHVGADLGRMSVGELGPSLLRAFLPVLSSLKGDVQRTNQAVLKALSAANSITLPIGFGLAAVAVPLTSLVLGERWAAAAPFVAGFAVIASVQFSVTPLNTLLILHGHTKTQSSVVWIELAAFVAWVLLLLPRLHLAGLMWARLLAMTTSTLVTVGYAQHLCGLSWKRVLIALWRPLLGAAGMFALVSLVCDAFAAGALQLAVGIGTGVCSYTLWLLASWVLAGRPEGLESTALEALRAVRKKIR